jgi:hypothetical protein
MRKFKIVTQTDSIEKGKPGTTADNWMDDCAPSALAAVANWLLGTAYTSKDGIGWVAKAGRKDRDGFGDPTTFPQIERAAKALGLRVDWAKSWSQVLDALAREDRALLISVDQPKNYPATVRLSKWAVAHKKRTGGKSYGHLTAAVGGPKGAQWADPTMTGKGAEAYAVEITVEELRGILSSRFLGQPHKGVRIVSVINVKPTPTPAITPIAASLPALPAPAPAPTPKPTDPRQAARGELRSLLARIAKMQWGEAKAAAWRRVETLRRIISRNK